MFIATHPTCTGARAALVFLIALGLAPSITSGEAVRADEPVSLYLHVEKDGSIVTGLKAANFRLYEDGELHPFFLAAPEELTSIAILVEYSRASGVFLEEIDTAIQGIQRHAPENHWYALATFSHTVTIESDFTNQPAALAAAWVNREIPVWNEIDTYDAVYEMLDKLGRLPGRRVLVLIGSGLDTFSEHSLDDVRRKVAEENVNIFVAGLGAALRNRYDPWMGASSRMNLMRAQAFLRSLAEESGGFAWFPSHSQAYSDVMEGVFQCINSQYRLIYNSNAPGSGKFHPIRVEAFQIVNDRRKDFQVLVRRGWR